MCTGGSKMINFEELDKSYVVDENRNSMSLVRKDKGLTFGDEQTVSEAFNKVKQGIVSKPFNVRAYNFAPLEDFITARRLNDELKLISDDFYVLVFGSLDHFVTKKPIEYSEEFSNRDKYTEHEIDTANQVLFLSPEKAEDKERVLAVRRDLANLLREGNMTTVEDLSKMIFE